MTLYRLHTVRISEKGMTVFPRLPIPMDISAEEQRKLGLSPEKITRIGTERTGA